MKIKVCGLTKAKEAEYLNRNKVDFAGFVLFYPKSKRNIELRRAKEIMDALNPEIKKVAVVVAPASDEVKQIEETGFDYIQIHGELSEEVINSVGIPILKAFNMKDLGQYAYYRSCSKVAGYVFDAQEPGSGKAFDWRLVEKLPRDDKLFLLAGGLNAENIREAVACVKPDGVDVSSGVEYVDKAGKDGKKIDEFVKKAREG